ncbi:hypothetical protein H0H92_009899, partial [Tricholoma furcatifolium]
MIHGPSNQSVARTPAETSDTESGPATQRSASDPSGANIVRSSEKSGEPAAGSERTVIQKSEEIIRNFETGRIDKSATCTSIAVAITGSRLPDSLRNQQLRSYYELIEDVDRKTRRRTEHAGVARHADRGVAGSVGDIIEEPRSQPIEQPRHGSPPRGSRDNAGNGDRSNDRPDAGGQRDKRREEIDKETDDIIRRAVYGKKRRAPSEPEPSDSDDSSSSSGDGSDRGRSKEKKRTFKRSKMAWRENESNMA